MISRYCRNRQIVDDRHNIRAPDTSLADMKVYTNTLVKTRIPKLFLTLAGLAGHAHQLQGELNRLKTVGPYSPLREEAEESSRFLKRALIKSKEAAQAHNFPFLWQL